MEGRNICSGLLPLAGCSPKSNCVAIASLIPQLPTKLKNTFFFFFLVSFWFILFGVFFKLASSGDLNLDMILQYFLLF